MIKINNVYGLGTKWWFEIGDVNEINTEDEYQSLKLFIENIIVKFENNYSRFNPESYLSKLNTSKFLNNPSDEMLELLQIALKYNKLTNGIFNPCMGNIINEMGYDKEYSI